MQLVELCAPDSFGMLLLVISSVRVHRRPEVVFAAAGQQAAGSMHVHAGGGAFGMAWSLVLLS